jgi:predicted DNA-binding transcriptional regulator AlpA
MQRTINAPDTEWLSAEECARWLGISPGVFRGLVLRGEFPRPVKVARRVVKWPWMDVVSYIHFRSRDFRQSKRKKRAPKGGVEG